MTPSTNTNMKDTKKKELSLTVLKIRALAIMVCTNAKRKSEIERLANEAILCGTTHGWVLNEKESRKLNQSKVTCANDPTRTHYILYA
jgi:hypothetical protein